MPQGVPYSPSLGEREHQCRDVYKKWSMDVQAEHISKKEEEK